jgi:hypothetical protein
MNNMDTPPPSELSLGRKLVVFGTAIVAFALAACSTEHGQAAPNPEDSCLPPAAVTQNTLDSTAAGVIFSADPTGHYKLYKEDLATREVTALTTGLSDDMNAVVSPSGEVVFYSNMLIDKYGKIIEDKVNNSNQIFEFSLSDPEHFKQLTQYAEGSIYDPVPLPDGRILYKQAPGGAYGDIYIMNGDGLCARQLTKGLSAQGLEGWKPAPIIEETADGPKVTKFVFTIRGHEREPDTDELYLFDMETDSMTRLTKNDIPDWYPIYNPLTHKIIYVTKSGRYDVLASMNPDGSDSQIIERKRSGDSDDPSVSPDGKTVAFVDNAKGYYRLDLLDLRTGKVTVLDDNGANHLGPAFYSLPQAVTAPANFSPTDLTSLGVVLGGSR